MYVTKHFYLHPIAKAVTAKTKRAPKKKIKKNKFNVAAHIFSE